MNWKPAAAAVFTAFLLAGCTAPQNTGSGSGSPEQKKQTAQVTAVDDFALAYIKTEGMNPITCSSEENQLLCELCYQSLFRLDDAFQPRKELCKTMEQDSSTQYSVTIAPNVSFHSGQTVTVEDVVYSLNNARLREGSVYQEQLSNISSITYYEDTITINLYAPSSNLAALLDVPIFRAETEGDDIPDGSGPYQMVSGKKGYSLVPFKKWSGGTVGFCKSIALHTVNDADEAKNLLSTGELSMLFQRDADAGSVQNVKYTKTVPTTTLHYLGINCALDPLDNASVRKALSLLMDRTEISKTCFAGKADAAVVPVNPTPASITLSPDGNKKEALSLLAEAGVSDHNDDGYLDYINGFGGYVTFKLDIIYNNNYSTKGAVLAQYAKQLEDVGIQTTITGLSYEECRSKLQQESFQVYYGEYRLHADFDMSSLISANGERNFCAFASDEMETAISGTRQADMNDRTDEVNAYLNTFIEQSPLIPVVFERGTVLSTTEFPQKFNPMPHQIFNDVEYWSAPQSEEKE